MARFQREAEVFAKECAAAIAHQPLLMRTHAGSVPIRRPGRPAPLAVNPMDLPAAASARLRRQL
jgi:hypothetical protein